MDKGMEGGVGVASNNVDKEQQGALQHVQEVGVITSIGPECNELKKAYDTCFNAWFADKFLKGDTTLDACDPLLSSYTDCVKRALKTKNVDLDEIAKDYLGTSNEKKKPA